MIIPPIFEIGRLSVIASGIATKEHIVFRPTETINLAQYGILVAFQDENGMASPLHDQFYWFGEIEVSPPSWVVLYTGKGQNTVVEHYQTKHPVYLFYWGKETTIFTIRELVPVLFRMAGVAIAEHLTPPQKMSELGISPPELPSRISSGF